LPRSHLACTFKSISRKEVKNVTEKGEVYVCEICGNKVQVLEAGAGTLVCCGQDMTLVE